MSRAKWLARQRGRDNIGFPILAAIEAAIAT